MKLKHKSVTRSSGTLGDESLFETLFVCVYQGDQKNLKLLYGKAPAQKEIGEVHASFEFPQSQRETVTFYTFASGEDRVTLGDVRVVKGRPEVLIIYIMIKSEKSKTIKR